MMGKNTLRVIICMLIYCLFTSCYCYAADNIVDESAQYELYKQTFDKSTDLKQKMNEIIALNQNSRWAGFAKIEIAKLLISEGEADPTNALTKFSDAENLLINVINSFGSLESPVNDIYRGSTGWILADIRDYNVDLTENIPIKLESLARLELAKLYIKETRTKEAESQLEILVNNKLLEQLKSYYNGSSMSVYFCYPEQEALRILFDLAIAKNKKKDAVALASQIEQYGFPGDIEYAYKQLENLEQKKQKNNKKIRGVRPRMGR